MYVGAIGAPSGKEIFRSVAGLPLPRRRGFGWAISGSDADDSDPESITCRLAERLFELLLPGESSTSLLAALTLGW